MRRCVRCGVEREAAWGVVCTRCGRFFCQDHSTSEEWQEQVCRACLDAEDAARPLYPASARPPSPASGRRRLNRASRSTVERRTCWRPSHSRS